MKVIIFGGPTISEREVKEILVDARFIPLAKHADVISVTQNDNPDVIGIVDGTIHSELSVWHKEILFALKKGIRVYGAGGIGAIRAAELHHFGMIGIGQVFELYKNNTIEDDDEVFVKFENINGQFTPLSEPMVNVRIIFNKALQDKIVDEATCTSLLGFAKSLHYTERSYERIFQRAVEEGIAEGHLKDLKEFISQFPINVPKQDALEMLREIAALSSADLMLEIKSTPYYNMLFAPLYERDRLVQWEQVEFPLYYISNYLCLYHPQIESINNNALNREMSLYLAEILQIEVDKDDIQREITRFRKKHQLEDDATFQLWVQQNDLPNNDFKTLFEKLARLRKMHYWFFTSRRLLIKNTSYLLEALKLENKYLEWKEKVGKREKAVQDNTTEFKETFVKEELATLFVDYLKNQKLPWNIEIKEAAKEMGMRKNDIKIEMVKEQLYREKILDFLT